MVRIIGSDAGIGLALASALLIGACGGGSSGGAQTIGKAGGTLSKSGVTLTIPAGALSADTAITVATTAAPSGYTLASAAYLFGPAGTTFAKPVTVSIALTGAPVDAHLFWSNPSGGFDDLGGTISTMTLTGEVTHFSVGFAGKPALDGGAAGSDGGSAGSGGAGGGSGGAGGVTGSDAGSDADAMPTAQTPVVLVPSGLSFEGPENLVIDDEYVYWVGDNDQNVKVIQRVPKAGGDVSVAYQPPNRPNGQPGFLYATLAVDSTSLYVVITDDIYHSEILKVAKDGSTHTEPSILQVQGNGAEACHALIVDGGYLYFDTNFDPSVGLAGTNVPHIARLAINGGARTDLFGYDASGPTDPVLKTVIGWPQINQYNLDSDGTNVYYAASNGPSHEWLIKVPVGGGSPVVLTTDDKTAAAANGYGYAGSFTRPAVSGGYLYWMNNGYVFKLSVDGGTPEAIFKPSADHGTNGYVITDGKNLYYQDGINLMRLPLTGGTPANLIDHPDNYGFSANSVIAVDDTSVYLMAFSGHGLVKVAK